MYADHLLELGVLLDVRNQLFFLPLHSALLSLQLANRAVDKALGIFQNLRNRLFFPEHVPHGVGGGSLNNNSSSGSSSSSSSSSTTKNYGGYLRTVSVDWSMGHACKLDVSGPLRQKTRERAKKNKGKK